MKANKCDRCGKYYDEYTTEIPEYMTRERHENEVNHVGLMGCNGGGFREVVSKPIDLCPECMEKLIGFLHGDEKIPDISELYTGAPAIMPYDASVKLPIIEGIPKDMRDRVYSIEQNASGDITVYFDTYFSNEDEKNEQPRDNSGKDDLQKH